ncbi:hypothetical protein [Mesorhizobium sp. RIZ17]|uniref:hypothetical protein n=1 Tax=Mesorhizobium sp. RIZ17 TaxID=3132743 RepID=UPI003DA86B5E
MIGRPILRLKVDELVPPEEDKRMEMGVYDLLLPCRRYDISYKVAILGLVSPTLEFLLRLVKAVPGLSEDDAREFFGYDRVEMEYVLEEATGPGYLEREGARLWLANPGERLFNDGDDGPVIYKVEGRRGSYGFDLIALAPELQRSLDKLEQGLPDLVLDEEATSGAISKDIPDRFRRFFRELGDRSDREQVQKRDLYSIDSVSPGDRFQVPIRMKVYAQAANPSLGEIDLNAWRPDVELGDRPEVERAAGHFLTTGLRASSRPDRDGAAYQTLIDLAPEFLGDFTIQAGLSVKRYWREAVSRTGDPRTDRMTVPLVGQITTQQNIERLLRVVDYGIRNVEEPPGVVLSVPPNVGFWGATSLLRDVIALLRRRVGADEGNDENEPQSYCIVAGKPAKYVEQAFDRVEILDAFEVSPSLEMLLLPGVAFAALVHAPIGTQTGTAAPLGFASFDPVVLDRAHSFVIDRVLRYVGNDVLRSDVERAMAIPRKVKSAETMPESGESTLK